ncbi:putative Ig domain-containing protein, partial [Escherichia coli]|uniref:putative Ig domain-containing protein n=1 Tax=Escherichia coli TaxID=562 RepID=UPI0034D1A47C
MIPTPTNTLGSVSWSSVGSALPAGLSVNASTGSLTGTPTAAGSYANLKLRVTDSEGKTGDTAAFTITITLPLTSSLTSSVTAKTGTAITFPAATTSGGT